MHWRELPAPPEAVAAVNCPGDWLLLALLSTYQAGVFHDYTGVRPAVLYDGPEGLALRLHRISGEEDGGAAMPAEEPDRRHRIRSRTRRRWRSGTVTERRQ